MQKRLESIVETFKTAPRTRPEGVKFTSRFTYMPIDAIMHFIGFNNYREHSLKETNTLSNSIKNHGLLEPITLAYDTNNDIWDFIDGEGRLWSCYQNGAEEVPVEIFYDVPEETRLRMKIAANSTKTKIDPEDLAKFTKDLYHLLEEYAHKHIVPLEGFRGAKPSIKGLSKITNRNPSTINKYFIFNRLDDEVRNYVDENRDKNLYSRSIKIGKTLASKDHQKIFFNMLLKAEEDGRRLSDYEFRTRLNKYAEFSKDPINEISMKAIQDKVRAGDTILKHIYTITRKTRLYIDAFSNLIEAYPEIKKDSKERIERHISELKNQYNRFMSFLPKGLSDAVKAYLERPPEKNFREKILEQAEQRRNKKQIPDISKRVKAIGEEELFIPVEDIVLRKSQLRSRYKKESVDALVEEMKEYGQIKPGLVREVTRGGKKKYEIIYGHTRFKAVTIAGLKYYKTFVKNGLKDLEISLLQSMEDLSEHDTAAERAKVLNKQYNLMKMKAKHAGKDYDKNDFLKDFKHLGTRKTLKDALEFMELDEHLRTMVHNKIIGYEAAIKIGKLSDDDRLNVLYNVMTSQMNGAVLDKYIKKVKDNSESGQAALFGDIPKSYSRILGQFEAESMSPFHYARQYLGNGNEQVKARILRPEVIIQYAQIYTSILNLENNMKHSKGFNHT
ncbi:MAG: ParB N-terminal domain-containing protein [Candidatus Woesearchaeota archaeon]